MRARHEVLLWAFAVCLVVPATRWMLRPDASDDEPPVHVVREARAIAPVPDDSLGALADHVVSGNVFRIARHASAVSFDGRSGMTTTIPGASVPEPPVAKAALTLKAIIGGPPWAGVIDGLPGFENGTVVRTGDTIGRFIVRSAGRDTVIVQSPDSLYHLTLRSDW